MITDTAVVAEVRDALEGHLDALLADLVAAESVNPPGDEEVAADVLARHLDALGLEPHVHRFAPGRANVVAPAGAWDRPRQVALCSHLDVVPVGPADDWSSPPFSMARTGQRLVGRGVCDAKGPIAVMALVLAVFERHRPGSVALAAVAGEEMGGVGSRALLDAGFRTAATIIGEPTALRVARAHKGRVLARVVVRGQGGHAAMPRRCPTAIDRLPAVLTALEQMGAQLAVRPSMLCGPPSLAVTQVHSFEGNTATVPAGITLTVDRRLVPGETHEEAAGDLERVLDGLDGVEVTWRPGARPCELPADHPLVTAAVGADPAGHEPVGLSATCDQYLWADAGVGGIVLGPGDLRANRAHASDEHIDRTELLEAGERYARTVLRYLEASA